MVKKLNKDNKLVEKTISEYFKSINNINKLVSIFQQRKAEFEEIIEYSKNLNK